VAGGPASAVGGAGGEAGSGSLASAAPNMIGDLGPRGLYREDGNFNGKGTPIVGQGAFRVVENESARPADRVFAYFNYFDATGNNTDSKFGFYRTILGFEKAFLDGRGSFGARLPIQFREGGTGESVDGFADVTLITKYALYLDKHTGSAASVGLAVTIPIGREQHLDGGGDLDSVLWQPWAGFVANGERFIVQGYTSFILPGKSLDTRLWTNDLGVGYKLWMNRDCGRLLTAVVPVLEAHLITPLSNEGVTRVSQASQVGTPDQLVLTTGVHLGVGERGWLTLGFGLPVTGFRLFQYEGVVQLNFGF
jgi:hypothetical protein